MCFQISINYYELLLDGGIISDKFNFLVLSYKLM
jgi:hypothetical protein